MSKSTTNISSIRVDIFNYLINNKYSESSILKVSSILTTIEHSLQNSNDDLSVNAIDKIIYKYRNLFDSKKISKDYFNSFTRVAVIVKNILLTGHIGKWKHNYFSQRRTFDLSSIFQKQIDDYIKYMRQRHISPNSINRYSDAAALFLHFVSIEGVYELSGITNELTSRFISYIKSKNIKNIADSIGNAKRFLIFLATEGRINEFIPEALNLKISKPRKILYGFSIEEENAILNAIDITTSMGKRDNAILTLAKCTGLRKIDIVNLKLTDIKWDDTEIHIIQNKTQKPLILPLVIEVGNALEDYILNGRPESKCDNIFLRSRAPYIGITDINDIVKKYALKSGITKTTKAKLTIHSFRRGLGVSLLESGSSLDMVKEIIGHSNCNASKKYLALEVKHLSECATPMKDFTPKGGHL